MGTTTQGAGVKTGSESTPRAILELTGEAVLLNVRSKTKAPSEKNWPAITLADMTGHYLGKLTSNIGVSLGAPSNGLHSIDCDEEQFFEELGRLNPRFADTLQSHGSRGGNYWIRIEGEYPKSGKIRLRDPEGQVGEWRSTGNQTIIHGIHPKGIEYRNNGKKAITLRFDEIQWPDAWDLPWNRAQATSEGQSTKATPTPMSGSARESREAVEVMLASIPPSPDRDLWMKLAAAVRNSVGDAEVAIEILKAWSPEWEAGEYAKILEHPFPEIGFGTLIHHAAEHGFRGAVSRFYYNGTGFAMQGSVGFIPLNEGAVRQHLAKLKIPAKSQTTILCDIRERQHVSYIGDVAGHQPGLHQCNGKQILVTTGPKIIKASKGDGLFIRAVLHDLLHDDKYPEQHRCFLDWLAHCRRAVIEGRRIQSPALVMAGQRGNGKSLTIEIINRSLGGRLANGYRHLCGDTPFNRDLLGAELIVMDDAAASKDPRSRIRLAQNIKNFLFAGSVPIEGKNKDSFNCSPVHAVVLAVNDNPEHLRVLPELDDTMQDKIVIAKTSPVNLPRSIAGREDLIKLEIAKTLPAFIYELDGRDLSGSYDDRGRLKCFWHPAITEAIGLLSNEQRLLDLIHQSPIVRAPIHNGVGEWVGTAATLETILTDRDSSVAHSARQLLGWNGACGTYLGKLALCPKSGVTKAGLDKTTRIQQYQIGNPRGGEETICVF